MTCRCVLLCSTLVAGFAFSGGSALAQDAETEKARTLDTVVVTARRTEERLEDVPLAIAAYNQDQLHEAGIGSADELAKVTPGLATTADSGNPALASYSIRGRGQTYGSAAGSVETYFAEIPLSSPFQMPALPAQYFDLESVQVLKGPQGTLFGRSTTGGAILFVPQAPTDTYEGYARIRGGDYDTLALEGAVNIPIGDHMALRLSGTHVERDGYMTAEPTVPVEAAAQNPVFAGVAGTTLVDPVTGEELTRTDYLNLDYSQIRASFRANISSALQNTLILTYHEDKTRATSGGGLFVGALNPGGSGSTPVYGYGTRTSYVNVNLDKPRSKAWAAINTTSWDISDDLTLKNIFGYIKAEGYTNDAADPDGGPLSVIAVYAPVRARENEQITNELQLQGSLLDDRLDFTLGALVDQTNEPGGFGDVTALNATIRGPISGGTPDPAFPGTEPLISRYQSSNFDNHAFFVSASYGLTDTLNLNAGFRRSFEKIEAFQGVATQTSGYAPLVESIPVSRNFRKDEGDSYNVELDYHPDDAFMIYGGLRHGWKRGGFNSSATDPALAAFGPEEVDDYHIGFKKRFDLGGVPAYLNVEGFYDKYEGLQVAYLSFDPAAGALVTISTNVPESVYRGVDVDFGIEPTEWLALTGAYANLDAQHENWPDVTAPGSTLDLTRNKAPFAPTDKFSLAVRFHQDFPGVGEFVLRPSLSYQSEFVTSPFNTVAPAAQAAVFGQFNHVANGGATVDAVSLWDLRVEWNEIMNTPLSAAVTAANLTDEFYYSGNSGTLNFGVQGNAYAPPRIVTFELSTRF